MRCVMKSLLFSNAISNRNRIRFIYGLREVILEPYYISRNKNGKKVVYGRVNNSNEVCMFEYDRIYNIKVLESNRFYPLIPILQAVN